MRELPGPRFATTQWSLVLSAGRDSSVVAREALADLCTNYWYPLYSFIRRQGYEATRAQDLTQEFFTNLIERPFLHRVDRSKGRFRSYLIGACKHFLGNRHAWENAQKRGGGQTTVSLDFGEGESRYGPAANDLNPEQEFDRAWAMTLLQRTLNLIEEEYKSNDKSELFENLKCTLTGERADGGYKQIAETLNLSEENVKVSAHRMRQRYREILRSEIGKTVDRPEDVDDEIRALFQVLGP